MDALRELATNTLNWLAPPPPALSNFKTGPPMKKPLMVRISTRA